MSTVLPSATRTMRAVSVQRAGECALTTTNIPVPGRGEVLIALEGCGVCGSNLPVWEGRPWFNYPLPAGSPGHEGWGRIVELGPDVFGLETGQRVAALTEHAFAEFDVAAAGAVVPLPPELAGLPFPAEPLACALNAFARSGIHAGEIVAVVGVGFLGSLLIQLAVKSGARVIAISRRPFALETARSSGADHTIPFAHLGSTVEHVRTLTGGRLCDCVIEAVGQQAPLDCAAEITRERGRLIIAGYHQDGARTVNLQLWNWRGLDVINAHERDPRCYVDGMQAAISAVTSGRLDPLPLFTHTFPLARIQDAFKTNAERPDGFMKALVLV